MKSVDHPLQMFVPETVFGNDSPANVQQLTMLEMILNYTLCAGFRLFGGLSVPVTAPLDFALPFPSV